MVVDTKAEQLSNYNIVIKYLFPNLSCGHHQYFHPPPPLHEVVIPLFTNFDTFEIKRQRTHIVPTNKSLLSIK